jgi:hypothetical protein
MLRVGEIISDENWYEYLKLFAAFLARIGYKGLVVFLDECVNLYKIPHKHARENNYEKLLYLFNDTMQGKASHLGIYMSGTPQFMEDERRGLYSYAALKSRLTDSRFVREGYVDLNGPVIHLQQLTNEELFLLLDKLADIHARQYGYPRQVTPEQITLFLQVAMAQMGAKELITPRELTRDYLGLLNILHQNQNLTFEGVAGAENFVILPADEAEVKLSSGHDEYADFTL